MLVAQFGLQFAASVVASFRLNALLPPVVLTIFIPFIKQVPLLPRTFKVKAFDIVFAGVQLSVRVTVMLDVAAAVGVPEILQWQEQE